MIDGEAKKNLYKCDEIIAVEVTLLFHALGFTCSRNVLVDCRVYEPCAEPMGGKANINHINLQ